MSRNEPDNRCYVEITVPSVCVRTIKIELKLSDPMQLQFSWECCSQVLEQWGPKKELKLLRNAVALFELRFASLEIC